MLEKTGKCPLTMSKDSLFRNKSFILGLSIGAIVVLVITAIVIGK